MAPIGKSSAKHGQVIRGEWPQHLHGPDNNAVVKDTVAGPPRHLQGRRARMDALAHDLAVIYQYD